MQLLANNETTADLALLNNLNRLVASSQNSNSSSATIGGFKVTVLGVQTTNKVDPPASASSVISSVSSSPSSMSMASSSVSMSSSMNGHTTVSAKQLTNDNRPINNGRSTLLTNNNHNHLNSLNPSIENRHFNTSYINPNSKQILEKHQKDLQRQTAVLTRISSVFQEDLNKSHTLLNQTFAQIRQLLNDRQAQMETQLISVAQTGSALLQQRQQKAAELRLLVDNGQHLSDEETRELKADIKHFVSERQLDEEFGKLKLLSIENLAQLSHSINSFGSVASLAIKSKVNQW
jgi:hypothetical protein